MKRYFLSHFLTGFALAAVIACIGLASAATPPSRDNWPAHVYSLNADDIGVFMFHDARPMAVAPRDTETIGIDVAALDAPILAPEYADSLRTDALNFVETRMRC